MEQPSVSSSQLHVSAPGKIILFGEHAVVYKRTGIAGAIALRLHLTSRNSSSQRVQLHLPDIDFCVNWDLLDLRDTCKRLAHDASEELIPPHNFLDVAGELIPVFEEAAQATAAKAFLYLYVCTHAKYSQLSLIPLDIRVESNIPLQAGVGSSGAFCVCLASTLLHRIGKISAPTVQVSDGCLTWTDEELSLIRLWASAAESIVHGRASGLDTAICALGGLLRFRDSKAQQFRKTSALKVIVVNTKVERNTSDMVRRVRRKYDQFPEAVELILDAIDKVSCTAEATLHDDSDGDTKDSVDRIINSPYARLQELCELNHGLLVSLGVGHATSDHVRNILKDYGISAKITGAGGGGCVFGFLDLEAESSANDAIIRLRDCGYDVWTLPLGCEGLVCHTSTD